VLARDVLLLALLVAVVRPTRPAREEAVAHARPRVSSSPG
jgi:hypothetical protein